MVAKYQIEQTLERLNKSFDDTRSVVEQRYFSKLALIELCAWIEEEVDKMFFKASKSRLRGTDFELKFKRYIDHVHGFHYEDHISKIMIQLVGYSGFLEIERRIDSTSLVKLKSVLGTLKSKRNPLAHTQLTGQTPHLLGFSVLKNHQRIIYSALVQVESALKEYLK